MLPDQGCRMREWTVLEVVRQRKRKKEKENSQENML
jgi:hypothetical protein